MPFNGAGLFTPVYNWQTDKANGIKIRADRMDGQDGDIATGLSTAITKDGQTTVTANIPLATFKITGMGAGTARTDAANVGQLQDQGAAYFTAAGTNAYTLTPVPAVTSYTAGQTWLVIFTNANTNAATSTLAVSGLVAKNITKNGATAATANDIRAGAIYRLTYDGTQFQLSSPSITVEQYAVATGTDTYVISVTNPPAAYAAGQRYIVKFTNANTGAATLNVNSVGAVAIVTSGSTALVAGDIAAGMVAELIYDGTNFAIIPSKIPAVLGMTNGGTKTSSFSGASNTRYVVDTTSAAVPVLLSPGIVGDIILLIKCGSANNMNLCGTVNGAVGTVAVIQEQTMFIGYTARGWV